MSTRRIGGPATKTTTPTASAARIVRATVMADSLGGFPDGALQRGVQSCDEEGGEPLFQQLRVVAVHRGGVELADEDADRLCRLAVAAAEEADKVAPAALRVLDQAQTGDD